MQEPSAIVDRLAHDVIGSAIEVHRHLGPGFLESVYENAKVIELESRGIPFERQKTVPLHYKGKSVGQSRLDFLIGSGNNILILELKAVESLIEIHRAQVISYLKAMKSQLGLLINFNVPLLKNGIERIILTQ